MTHRVDRRICLRLTWPLVLGVLALLVVPSTRVGAQAAVADADRWESAIAKFEDTDKVTPPPQGRRRSIADSAARWRPTRRGMPTAS